MMAKARLINLEYVFFFQKLLKRKDLKQSTHILLSPLIDMLVRVIGKRLAALLMIAAPPELYMHHNNRE